MTLGRVEVPGGWIEVRPPKAVPERLRRPVVTAMSALVKVVGKFQSVDEAQAALTADPQEAMFEASNRLNDVSVVALVSAWSFGETVTADTAADLPAETYDAVQRAIAPHIKEMLPDFSPDGVADPKAVTAG